MVCSLPQLGHRYPAVFAALTALAVAGCPLWPGAGQLAPLLPGASQSPVDGSISPAGNSRSLESLRSPIARERLEALRAWAAAPPRVLPVEVTDLRADPDPRVRAVVMEVLARVPGPRSLEYLTAALNDRDLQVRSAAIAAIGALGGADAQATLERVLKTEGEVPRAAAVAALAQMGAWQAVMDAAADRSWRVRLAVARALAQYPNRNAASLAGTLLEDPSSGVQQEVITAIAEWPVGLSGPILLTAMGKTGYLTRKTAAAQLAARWPPASEFTVDGPAERRAQILQQLQQRFREEIASTEVVGASGTVVGDDGACQPAAYVEPAAESLAGVDPALAPLDRLAAADVVVRRRAARELTDLTARHPPRRAVVERLASLAEGETDPLVWQDLLAVVSSDGSAAAARLAYAAIRNPSTEVRRRACEHLAAHPSVAHVPILLPAVEDESVPVAGAAVRALAAAGRVEDAEPIRRLLTAPNELLRVEAAVALAQWGDPAGPPALERLAASDDPIVRRRLAVALGGLSDPGAVSLLIRLLDDRPDIRRAALESLPKSAGQDVTHVAGQPMPSPSEQAVLWKEWFERPR